MEGDPFAFRSIVRRLLSDPADALQNRTTYDLDSFPLTIFSLHPHTNWPGAKRFSLGLPLSTLTLFFCVAAVPTILFPPRRVTMFKLSYIVYTPQHIRLPPQLEPVSFRARRRSVE